jgi:predicted DNA-binding protein (UPF0251 family)
MPRPRKKRFCRRYPADRVFKPQGIPMSRLDSVVLTLDQFETLRLCDLERLNQEAAGWKLKVSRGTIQRLLYEGRRRLVEAILNNKAIMINLKESEDFHVSVHSHQRRRRS